MKKFWLLLIVAVLMLSAMCCLAACSKAGQDGADGINGVDGKDGADGHSPVVSIVDGYWMVDGVSTGVKAVGTDGVTPTVEIVDGRWVINGQDTGVKAVALDGVTPTIAVNDEGYWVINGEVTELKVQGEDGRTPAISVNEDGYWVIDGVPTEVSARGSDGVTPTVEIVEGNWVINGQDSGIKAVGTDGSTPTVSINDKGYWVINGEATAVNAIGEDGHAPTVSVNEEGYWAIDGVSTGVSARGTDGVTPTVEIVEGNWVINGQDSGVKAAGTDGYTPLVSINDGGYWVINGVTTDILARGTNGITPTISVNADGYWVINGEETELTAIGKNGESPALTIEDGYWTINGNKTDTLARGTAGKSIYETYQDVFGYEGTIEEWLTDVLNGTLDVATPRTVTYDYAGLTGDALKQNDFVQDGRTLTLPVPERTGYIFLGWYKGEGETAGKWTNVLPVSEDMTLTARWQKQTFTVRYLDQGGECISEQYIEYGEDALPPAAPYVANHTFDHWDDSGVNVTSDLTVSPVYYPDRYTVTYDTDGGSSVAPVSYLYNETPVRPTAPTKSGKYFEKWVYAESGDTYAFNAPLAVDTTLKAVWSDSILIHDATELSAIRSNANAKYCLANDIDLEGAEWSPISTFGGTLDGQGYVISDFKLTASNTSLAFIQTNNGTIKDLIITDVTVNQTKTSSKTAVLAVTNSGTVSGVTVRNAILNYSTGSKTSDDTIGGLVSVNKSGARIIGCDYSGNIIVKNTWTSGSESKTETQKIYIGGLVGTNAGAINDSVVALYARLNFTGATKSEFYTGNGYYYFGGICGCNSSKIERSDANLDIEYTISSTYNQYLSYYGYFYDYSYIGGIAGESSGTISKVRSSGRIYSRIKGDASDKGDNDTGGIVGNLAGGSLNVAYSTVNVSSKQDKNRGDVGGIASALQNNCNVSNVWFNGVVSGNKINHVAGICAYNKGTIDASYMTGTLSATDAGGSNSQVGLLVGSNKSSGIIRRSFSRSATNKNNVGVNEGTNSENYKITESNRLSILNEDYLYGENMLSMTAWGVCEGLAIYLKDFACETHDYTGSLDCGNRYCKVCGYATPPVDGHSFTEYVYDNNATCTADGTETAHCAYGCGTTHTRTKEGTATGHSYTNYADYADATCITPATEKAYCDHGCGTTDVRAKEGEEALGHYYTQGKCLRCGVHSPAVTAALDSGDKYYHVDMDRDGTYSLGDYVYFGYYPQSVKAANVTPASEADGDGYYLGSDGYRYALIEETYYRVEPVRWIVKGSSAGAVTLFSEKVLFAAVYQSELNELDGVYYNTTVGTPEYTYANEYEHSALAKSLTAFSDVAFDADSAALLDGTVSVPSKGDLMTAEYGFATSDAADATRTFGVTAYADAAGGCWTRTAYDAEPYNKAYAVTLSTGAITAVAVDEARGVLPVVVLNLGE